MFFGLMGDEIVDRVVVSDSYNRVNSGASMGSADTGQVWVPRTGTWGISDNRAYLVINALTSDAVLIDAGIFDIRLKVTLSTFVSTQRVEFRSTDVGNKFQVVITEMYYDLYRIQGGVATIIGRYTAPPVSGDVIEVVTKGNSIIVNINDVQRISVTDTFNQTATNHGISTSNTIGRFDDFTIKSN